MKIDDLLDLLTEKASAEVAKRNPEFSAEECRRTAAQIAVAAIRYFMLKFSRGKLIVFDIEEALSFEGETGPYLQYAVVRANNIFHKLKERERAVRSARSSTASTRSRPTSSTSDEDATPSGPGASKRRVSTMSSNRWCGRWSFRRWRNMRSGSHSCSTRSITTTRS